MEEVQDIKQSIRPSIFKLWWFWVLVVAAVFAISLWLLSQAGSTFFTEIESAPIVQEAVQQKLEQEIYAPDFVLPDVTGKKIKLSDFSGQFVILSFWTSWNQESLEQLKVLNEYQTRTRQSAVILAVNSQEDKEVVQNIWRRGGYIVPMLLDQEGIVGDAYKISVLPLTVFINQQGYIGAKIIGLSLFEDIETQLKLMTK